MSRPHFIPFHKPSIGAEEIREVTATLRSGWLTTGPRTDCFEKEFSAYTGCKYSLALNSCTAALHLALVGLGVGPGDEVITTPMTFCSTVTTILHSGATPVLADVDHNGNIDPDSISQRITSRTRAIIPVHLAGYPCKMRDIWRLARDHGLFVVEDAAHAAGTLYRGSHLGSAESASDAVAFSFYATKNITTGEGGMLTTNNAKLAERLRRLALHGISKDAWNRYTEKGTWYYEVLEPGFKYNLSDVQSAIGIHQLRKLEKFIEMRRTLVGLYQNRLGNIDELETPAECDYGRHSWHLYLLNLNLRLLNLNRDDFIGELKNRQIGSSVHFIPVPLHPFFADWAARPENQCHRALTRYRRTVSLPLYPGLTADQVIRVTSAIATIIHNSKKRVVVSMSVSA